MTITNEKLSNLDIKYHFLIDNILDVVGELDLNGIFTYINPYIYDELGYQPDEMIGREIYEFVHPDDAKKITKVLLRRSKSHDFIPEIRLKNDQNQFIWYEIKARRIKDYINQRKILITLKNVSKVKVLEEKLEKKEENYQKITNSIPEIQFWKVLTHSKYERAVRTTSEMLKVIIENIPQCVFWKDTNFEYLGCNGNYSKFIGIEHPESIVGKTDEDLLSNKKKIQQIRESETNVMLSGKPLYHTNESWTIEKGENIWLDINRVPLIDTKGDVNGILVTFEEITDRKIADEKLRKSEKKYKNLSIELETIMDIIPSMIFVKNKGGIYTRVNQVFADYLKLEKEDIIGKSTFDLFPQEVATNLKRDDLEVIKNGIPKLNIEKTVEFPVGKVSGIISKMPYYNEKDEINGIIGFAIDISERKELEQRLIKSEEKYRNLVENAQEGVWAVDENNDTIFVNPKICEMLGYTKDEMMGKNLDLFLDDSMLELTNSYRNHREKGLKNTYDLEFIKKDGTPIYTRIKAAPFLGENGVFKGSFAYITDITDKMKAEQRLKESEENYRLITENTNDIIAVLDDKFRPEYISETPLNKMLGYTSSDYIGKSDFLVIHPDDRKMVLNGLIKGSEVGEGISDARLRHKDGHYIWVESRGKIFIDSNREKKILINIRNITQRKKAEQKLKESEEKYKNLFEKTPMAILLINLEGIIEDCNTSTEVLFGYTKEELLGFPYLKFDIFPHDTKLILAKSFSKFLKTGVPEHSEIQMYRKDGKKIWINSFPIQVNIAEKSYILAVIQDITDRKKAEQKLKESEEKYRLLFENANDAISILDLEGNFYEVNDLYCTRLGYTREEILKSNIRNINTSEYADLVTNRILDIREKGFNIFESAHKAKDGRIILVEISAKSILYDNKPSILSIIRDLTERKNTEQKLIESEAKHRGLLETAVMGLIEIDLLLNKISYANPKLLEIVGYTKEELKDDSFFYNLIHPEDLDDLLKSHGDRDVEFRIYSKEGKLKWLSGTRKYIISENGELINVRLWLQDITESKEVEEIKSNLLTRFSHEFKTPLISITGFADFLLTEHKKHLDKKSLLFLKRIKDGSDRLKKLINSFVESSQLDKAIVQLNLRQENLYDLINEALDELEGLRHLRKHEIDLNIGKKLITSLDKEKIYTVITNLLINAFNYSPKSGKIVIQSKIDKKSIVISIKDTGIGLDESEIIRLFKPFGKIERYGKGWDVVVGGMGMGLFISKELIELHDGKIWAESEGRNKGSTFHFNIPITK